MSKNPTLEPLAFLLLKHDWFALVKRLWDFCLHWSFLGALYVSIFFEDSGFSLNVDSLERPFPAISPSDGPPHHAALAFCIASVISPSFLLIAFFWYRLRCLIIRLLVPWNQGVGCILGLDNCWDMTGNLMKWQGDKRPFSTWCHPVEATCNSGVVLPPVLTEVLVV